MRGRDPAKNWFRCTDAERAAFEAGIKLGGIYHQFVGMAVRPAAAAAVERAIEASVRSQPLVEDVRVRIDRRKLRRAASAYGYASLAGEMLRVEVTIRCGKARAVAAMEYVPQLRYPLMFIRGLR